MEYKHVFVPFDLIHSEDTQLKISTGAVSAALVQSIKRIGLLNPPALLACSSGYRIVSGFKRIEASRQTTTGGIVARVLGPVTPLERCIQIAIADNTSQRSLNIVEQAHAVALLSSVYPDRTLLAGAANLVGLSINPDMADKLIKLAGMDPLLKSGVMDGSIALPVAMQLHDMNDVAAARVLGILLRELGLSLNRQREILEWVVSICRRDDMAPAELLVAQDIVHYRQNKDLDRRQKGQLIREYLKKRRYPTILRYERRFADTVRRLKLSKGTHLIAPPHFESSIYGLKFEFKNQSELADKLQEMEKIVKSEIMQIFWDDSQK
jgi:ParB family chromosome partitioning protein